MKLFIRITVYNNTAGQLIPKKRINFNNQNVSLNMPGFQNRMRVKA